MWAHRDQTGTQHNQNIPYVLSLFIKSLSIKLLYILLSSLLSFLTSVFIICKNLIKYVCDFAYLQDYVVTTRRSIINNNIYLICNKSGKYRNKLNLINNI